MAAEAFLVDRADGILTLSFNRPDHGNAIPSSAVPLLIELFLSVAKDPDVKVIIVRGNGKNFSAGGDVQAFARSLDQSVEERRTDFGPRLDRVAALVEAYLALDVPVIATCRGGVAGAGLMYALGADYVLADESAAFVFAHQRVGLIPDSGVSFLLPRVVGERRAMQLVLGAARIDAQEACRIGIVTRIVEAETLDEEVHKLAEKLARGPSAVMQSAKRLIRASSFTSLDRHLVTERDAIVMCVGEAAFEEGVRAFVEKRSPDFSQV
jgi:2-(1,2-epoxy-1,2-dihydrophenyl)acetyl-CoA isomerase